MNDFVGNQVFRGEWLEEIPLDWEQRKIRHLFSIKKEIAGELGHEVISITQRGAKLKDTESGEGQLSMDYSKYQLVKRGDFLMNHMDLLTGYVDVSEFDGVTSPDYRVFVPSSVDVHSPYFLYVFQHCYKSKIFYGYGRGSSHLGRWRFPTVEFEDFYLPVPTTHEQKLIARYLDKKTDQIDRLVEKIQKKIELLKEQRTSLINHYVTKGLDPNVEMKDSGIDWVGDIPKHWEVKKLKHTADVTLGKMLTPENKGGMYKKKYLRSVNVQEDYLDLDDINEMWFSENEIQKLSILHGDILVNEGGQVGRPCFIYENLIDTGFQNSINRIRTYKSDSYYLYLVILSGFKLGYYDSIVDRVSIPHLTKEKLENSSIIHPPKTEQQAISKKIEAKISFFSTRLNKQEERLALIREYRQSLISSAVTGKIRITEDMI